MCRVANGHKHIPVEKGEKRNNKKSRWLNMFENQQTLTNTARSRRRIAGLRN